LIAIGKLAKGKILAGGVGVGKSRTAIAYFYLRECNGKAKINGKGEWKAPETPKDIYIITTAKKRDELDWQGEAALFGISMNSEDSIGGIKLTVDSWNNIQKYKNVYGAFFVFDEQRLVGGGAWVKSFLDIARKNSWILLSATPGDNWLDYIPVFVANGFYKNRTEFKREHVVYESYTKFPKVKQYLGEKKLERLRDSIIVEMPLDRLTTRHELYKIVEYDRALFKTVLRDRWNPYTQEPIRDVAELYRLMRRVVNEDQSRIWEIERLIQKHKKLIIFYNFNYELDILRNLGTIVPIAEWNGHKHQEIPEGDTWVYLVQYTAGAEGWNCITTDTMVFYSLPYSYKLMEQAKGRTDRMNTPFIDLYYYIFRSAAPIDMAILRTLKRKKNFNERSQKWIKPPTTEGVVSSEW
jgi:hypothetical protein